ncbi:hypothetical protein M8818_000646 [Zalaria obscura]|uniref:Uncharacterized protein n=1 Tax=Zalaria obscura TaxID=2024903 RepID=A0ACC3SMI4_9PEZI
MPQAVRPVGDSALPTCAASGQDFHLYTGLNHGALCDNVIRQAAKDPCEHIMRLEGACKRCCAKRTSIATPSLAARLAGGSETGSWLNTSALCGVPAHREKVCVEASSDQSVPVEDGKPVLRPVAACNDNEN